jgi:hypothetical protein
MITEILFGDHSADRGFLQLFSRELFGHRSTARRRFPDVEAAHQSRRENAGLGFDLIGAIA